MSTNGLMGACSKASGATTRCTDMVYSHGLITEDMKESILMIRNVDKELSTGLMEANTDGVHSWLSMANPGTASGTWAREPGGWMSEWHCCDALLPQF